MADGYYRAIAKELRKCGYARIAGGKGSHEKWCRESDGKTLIVPRNLKSRHTANAILADCGSEMRV